MYLTIRNKRNISYFIIFLMGILLTCAYFYFKNKPNKATTESSQVIQNEIKKMSKLMVIEGSYSDVYQYKSEDQYLGNLVHFEKKVLVVVNAKVQVMYDLKKMDITLDTVNKIVIINKIPKAETQIVPDVKYYDIEQSTFNKFSAEDLNKVKQKAIERISNMAEKNKLEEQAREQLMLELNNFILLTKSKGWKVQDNSQLIITSPLR